ncbi:pilus assembly protein [Evansella sp. LMS18]|uniref:TadE/TadG family type IV pilus assembly protein n=1 Tax=Evansella sp. LMS18 TaxID=2924033 RepID=UPI0020D184D8|nr:TadE family protein [Evansella sp. LMS18]UTR11518.1 pilus assembly protein [Evansella sp. LMS18]
MKKQKGQSLVEFALVLPVLILLLCGIADFGRGFHIYLTLDHAGREAARAASVQKENTDIRHAAISNAGTLTNPALSPSHIQISPDTKSARTTGSDVTITIRYPFSFVTPAMNSMFSGFQIQNTTVMRIE